MGDILQYEAKSERVLIAGEHDTPTPYIAARHQAPVHVGRDRIRLMLQITSPRRAAAKLKFRAGSETGMGAFISDVPPETAAAQLRDALDGLD